jgi:hypothetical protein
MVLGLSEVLIDVIKSAYKEGLLVEGDSPPASPHDFDICIGALAEAVANDRLLPEINLWGEKEFGAVTSSASPKPELFWRELKAAISSLSGFSQNALRISACFLAHYCVRFRVRNTTAEALPIVLEAMRVEGLRTMKKWLPWQIHRSSSRMGQQLRFMFATSGYGVIDFKMLDFPKFLPSKMSERDEQSIRIEICARLDDLEESKNLSSELATVLFRVAEELPDRHAFGPYSCEPLSSRLNGMLVYFESTYNEKKRSLKSGETIPEWANDVIGDPREYVSWREKRARGKAAKLELRNSIQVVPDHNFLRPEEHLCPTCFNQTCLVSETVRTIDEPQIWYRNCALCMTSVRQ